MSHHTPRLLPARPLLERRDRGASILEMVVSAAIIGIVSTYTFVAVSNSMAAKKDVDVDSFAAQFEEPLRATLPGYLLEEAERSCLGDDVLAGKKISTEYTYEAFQLPNPKPINPPKHWADAWSRCTKGWTFNRGEQTAHFCHVIKATSKHRNALLKKSKPDSDEYDPDFTFVEGRFSLFNLATERNFARCTPPSAPDRPLPVAADEYFGNINRGYRLYYTIYSFKKGGDGKRRYDETSGFKQAGANSTYAYCVTRDKDKARKPGGNAGCSGKECACDFKATDVKQREFQMATIEIPEDAKKAFYPPPPDPCEVDPKLPECQPPAPDSVDPKKLFAASDRNQDKQLKAVEIPAELASRWEEFDGDKSSSLDDKEFLAAWAAVVPAPAGDPTATGTATNKAGKNGN